MNNIGNVVSTFYNRTPFPDYDINRFNSREDLKTHADRFAKILDRSIPSNASILDVGTGTGQLSAYLSLRRKNVFGIDFSDSSLDKAKLLKKKLQLDTLHLKKVDITNKAEIDAIGKTFDYVLCLGVLHHTADAYRSFQNITTLLNEKGKIAVGLYNRYGRVALHMRKFMLRFKKEEKAMKQYLPMQLKHMEDTEKLRGWWNDQYKHPHETTHTVGEVLRWFKLKNIDFVQITPPLGFNKLNLDLVGVWHNVQNSRPSFFLRTLGQFSWIFTTNKEGGYWITFGKKK